jgi:hypothetical protein
LDTTVTISSSEIGKKYIEFGLQSITFYNDLSLLLFLFFSTSSTTLSIK